ncbi:MAG: hypothetical protein LUC49_06890 [Prevotella sp.]|nr:hypothetical protein [Prevotella sp.]
MGGRGKGTPNKITSDLKRWVAQILDGGRERFEASLNDLQPAEFIRVYTGLLNYVLPKQSPVSPESGDVQEKVIHQIIVSSPEIKEMMEHAEKYGLDG